MKIALLGYGKMGKVIEQIALARNHHIVLKISANSGDYDITQADIAIDFSTPEVAVQNISNCIRHGIPVISGTTGWMQQYDSVTTLCKEHDGAFIYASNFSLGVHIFFELNKILTKLMQPLPNYSVAIEEIHHTQKLDAPSGTAITLAQDIIDNSNYTNWLLDEKKDAETIPIKAIREDGVTGTHTISYQSTIDDISIKHKAHNREGFALGAVIAAEWLLGKTGIFTMKDVLNIG